MERKGAIGLLNDKEEFNILHRFYTLHSSVFMNIKLNTNSYSYLLYQRTGYLLRIPLLARIYRTVNKHRLKKLSQYIYKQEIWINSKLRRREILNLYKEDLINEFETFKTYLPKKITSVLDIGCGLAGIDIFINQHYNFSIDTYLIDRTEISKDLFYSYYEKGAFYNSLTQSKALLIDNGIKENTIFIQEATEDNAILFDQNFDLILSLLSWGFHFPVSAYLEKAYKKLNSGGILLLDVRVGTNGIEEIKNIFGNCSIIQETIKYHRVIAVKN